MGDRLTFLGHSTVLVDLDGVRVLTDPIHAPARYRQLKSEAPLLARRRARMWRSHATHPRSPRVRSVAATITCVSHNLVPSGALICTEVGADDEMCGLPAEWVALEGPIHSMVASPRCIAHALAASRAGCLIRPITPAEFAAGELAI